MSGGGVENHWHLQGGVFPILGGASNKGIR